LLQKPDEFVLNKTMNENDTSSSDEDQYAEWEEVEEEEETEEEIAAAAERRRLELISLLQRKGRFLTRTRNKIDREVKLFLANIKTDIQRTLCANDIDDSDFDGYCGLDSDRDTEEELEATIRLFPDVLSTTGGPFMFYPIQCLSYCADIESGLNKRRNLKAVLFIPLVTRLAIEFGSFDEECRGGLLYRDRFRNSGGFGLNTLQYLMLSNDESQLVDDKNLLVIKQLRRMGYLKKEDIRRHRLFYRICDQVVFPEKLFQFLVEWDPTSLILNDDDEHGTILHKAVLSLAVSLRRFQLVFEHGIHYYPNKKGINLLFKKDYHNETPIHDACKKFGRARVMDIIEETLLDFQRRSDDDNKNGSYNIVDALVTAAIDEDIHLDCVYFLLRRHPDVLHKLLLSSPSSSSSSLSSSVVTEAGITTTTTTTNNSNSNNNYKSKLQKRKRGS
jgi:hypothetical protein